MALLVAFHTIQFIYQAATTKLSVTHPPTSSSQVSQLSVLLERDKEPLDVPWAFQPSYAPWGYNKGKSATAHCKGSRIGDVRGLSTSVTLRVSHSPSFNDLPVSSSLWLQTSSKSHHRSFGLSWILMTISSPVIQLLFLSSSTTNPL